MDLTFEMFGALFCIAYSQASVSRLSCVSLSLKYNCVSRNTENAAHFIVRQRFYFEAYYHKNRSGYARRLSDWYLCSADQDNY